MAKLQDVTAKAQHRAVFQELGRELSKVYAPRPLTEQMTALLARLQTKAN